MTGRGTQGRDAPAVAPRGRGRPSKSSAVSSATSIASANADSPEASSLSQQPQPSTGNNSTDRMLARVPEATRQAMANLIGKLKGKTISGRDFQTQAIALLGPQMYEELVRKPAAQLAAVHLRQQTSQQPTNQPQSGQGQQTEEVDVSRMDSAALQDVLKYSNIDLRAESELINRELQHPASGTGKTPLHSLTDPRSRPGHYCNAARLKYIAAKVAIKAGLLRGIDDEACAMIAIGLQRRITDLLVACIENSRHRVDRGRANWKIRIVNDPRKQLGVLEQAMRARDDKPIVSGDGSKKPRLEASQQQQQSSQQLQSTTTPQQTPAIAASDAAVKAKLANVTAMAAVGLKRKSWMTATPSSATAPLPPANSPSDKPQEQPVAMQADGEPAECPINFATAPSATALTDKQLFSAFASRTINGRDLTLVIEQDPRLARSSIALLLYDLANSFD